MPAKKLCRDPDELRAFAAAFFTIPELCRRYRVSKFTLGRWLDEHAIEIPRSPLSYGRKPISDVPSADYGRCYWCNSPAPGARCCADQRCEMLHKAWHARTHGGALPLDAIEKARMTAAFLMSVTSPIYAKDARARADLMGERRRGRPRKRPESYRT